MTKDTKGGVRDHAAFFLSADYFYTLLISKVQFTKI